MKGVRLNLTSSRDSSFLKSHSILTQTSLFVCDWIELFSLIFYTEKEPESKSTQYIDFLSSRGEREIREVHDSWLHVFWTVNVWIRGHEFREWLREPRCRETKKKVFSVSTLPWRSPELTQVMHSLDRKLMRRRSAKATNMLVERHRSGIISSRPAPDDADAYALA